MVSKPTHVIQCGECANASHRKITWAQVLLGIRGLVYSQNRGSVWGPLASLLCFCLSTAGLLFHPQTHLLWHTSLTLPSLDWPPSLVSSNRLWPWGRGYSASKAA